jgi:hypothetical protein
MENNRTHVIVDTREVNCKRLTTISLMHIIQIVAGINMYITLTWLEKFNDHWTFIFNRREDNWWLKAIYVYWFPHDLGDIIELNI